MARMKPAAKFALILLIVGGIVGGLIGLNKAGILAPKGQQAGTGNVPKGMFGAKSSGNDIIKVGVVTWGGYAGGQYFNNGFNASSSSRFTKEYGIKVQFKVIDDFVASRAAWKAGEIDLLWCTIDAFPTEVNGLKAYDPKFVFQADWSRGGDAIVVKRGINSANDLLGKKIAVAFGTPSHTFLLYALDAGDLNYTDVDIIEVSNAIDAAAVFKAGKVDAAVVWSPDDADCVKNVNGAKVLMSTKKAGYIIADGFFAKSSYINSHRSELKSLVEGWLKGAAEINSSDVAKRKAAKILSAGFGPEIDESFCYSAINNVRLCTYTDNQKFFSMVPGGQMTGRRLYERMGKIYKMINLVRGQLPDWNSVIDLTALNSLSHLANETSQVAEKKVIYKKPTKRLATAKAVSTKRISITFPTGSSTLGENAKTVIDYKFADILSMSTNRIRIEGNTDNTGSRGTNMSLSKRRAKAVSAYLVRKYSVSPNRFVIIGNGPDKPVGNNSTDDGRRKNRRTDFMLLDS